MSVDERDAEAHESLEAERDFLLRSLDDLEANRAAGDIDDETYDRLHADYTARAAAVIRALRDGVDTRPLPTRTSPRRRVAVIGGLLAFAVAASVALAYGLGARLPGQTVTGNSQPAASSSRETSFKRAVQQRPNDAQAHLTYARFLLGLGQTRFEDALKQYTAAASLDRTNAESRAYAGWLLALLGQPDVGLEGINRAIQLDGTYADAHFFKGVVLFRMQNKPCPAVPELQRFLAVANGNDAGPSVEQLLQQAMQACKPKSP